MRTKKVGRRRLVNVAGFVSLVLLVVSPWPGTALGATIVVDGDDPAADADGCGGGSGSAADFCNTIQAGVDASQPGDTVRVYEATFDYPEAVNVNKQGLSVVGPHEGVPGFEIHRVQNPYEGDASVSGPYDQAALRVTAPDVRIDGLRIRDSFPGISLESDRAVVRNNLLDYNGTAVQVLGNDNLASQNGFYSNFSWGTRDGAIYSASSISNLEISGNDFGGQQHTPAISLIGAQKFGVVIDSNVSYANKGLILRNLASSDVIGNLIYEHGSPFGTNEPGLLLDDVQDVVVVDNSLLYSPIGIQFGDATAASLIQDVTISGNEIIGNGADTTLPTGGVYVTGGTTLSRVSIVANRIVDNSIWPRSGGVVTDASVTQPVNAENNWWGCNKGPGSSECESVRGAVDANPWLLLSLEANPAQVTVPGSSELRAHFLRNSEGAMASEATAFPVVAIDFLKESGPGTFTSTDSLVETFRGVAVATLRSSSPGSSAVRAELDSESARTTVGFSSPPAAPHVFYRRAALDNVAPVIGNAAVVPAAFAVDSRGVAERPASARVSLGTTFRYALSERASVVFTIEQRLSPQRTGRRCRRVGAKRRRGRCKRYRLSGRFTAKSKRGRNSKRFSGRIAKTSLRPGGYRATLLATDSAGNRSNLRRLNFRVVHR